MELAQILEKYQAHLQQELREVLALREGLLYTMMQYQLGWIDYQGSPVQKYRDASPYAMLCLIACDSLADDHHAALPAAAAVELVKNYSVVHSDIRDGILESHHTPTVWWVWGPGQAINAGDGMHALGRLALLRLNQNGLPVARVLAALSLLDEACLAMCEGQHMNLSFQERLDVGTDVYLNMVERTDGALTGSSMGLGALIATGQQEIISAFTECGKRFSVAIRIRRDVSEMWPQLAEETPSPYILNKKKSLPIVYLMEKGSLDQKRKLGTIYFKRVLEPSDVGQIRDMLDESDARKFAEDTAMSYHQKAMDSLKGLPETSWSAGRLEDMVQLLISQGEW